MAEQPIDDVAAVSRDEAGAGMNLPVPVAKAADTVEFSTKLRVLAEPYSLQTEAIAALRNQILGQHMASGRRSLALCGATSGAGCTFVSANLAVALSQAGVRTVLIDGNLRDPGVQDYFVPDSVAPGLADYLEDPSVVDQGLLRHNVLPHLSLIFAGHASARAQELLATQGLKVLVDDCIRNFDIVLVDTPPANSASDARRIAQVVHYAMVVARKNGSFVSDLRTLVGELHNDRTRVIGTFLNDY